MTGLRNPPVLVTGLLAALALALASPGGAAAQEADDAVARAIRLVADANQMALRGDTAAALARLEQATKLAPNLSDAHYRRGMLLAHQAGNEMTDMFKRRAAGAALERAIRIERGNPSYYLELGRLRLKQGLGRLGAQRMFDLALNAARQRGDAAVIAETEAELGDIYHRRFQALDHRRLMTNDASQFDPDEAINNPHYAKDFLTQRTSEIEDSGELDLRRAEAHYRSGATAWPGHDRANAGLLGILLDEQRIEEFHEQARRFMAAAPKNPRAQLFLGLGLWRMGRAAEATRAFDRGLAGLTPGERSRLTNLSAILRRSDAEDYQGLTAAQRAEFDRIYWAAGDPLRLTPENEHLLEHLARAAYADLRFSAPELHLRGWDTDRGVIYMRYGPPPVVASFAPQTDRRSTDPAAVGKITTVWFYPERNLRFVFYGPPGYNFARFAGEFQAYVEDTRYQMPVKYDNVPVNEAMDSISVQVAAFRGTRTTDSTELVFFAGLPLARMAEGVDLIEGPIEHGLFITDPLERDVKVERRQETVRFHSESQLEQRTFTSALPAGEYRFRVEARQPTTRRAARGANRLEVDDFARSSLMLSDVVMADRVAPRLEVPTGHRDFLIDPNPAMRYTPGGEVHLLWEMYNLTADSLSSVWYDAEIVLRVQSIERRGFAARIVGGVLDAVGTTAEGDDQVSVRYEVRETLGNRDRLPGWVAVDLEDAPLGTYVLELVITDRISGQSALRRRVFTVSDIDQ
ncbi:MAG: GWxTD domain-containing protein [Gemmatimonadota bacterium]|nr:GWxTD domain-containing protein [Gemmatimonadota bacterium]MDH5196559.1 GWxTD domain-containing protein [Gemmatimonadota bacterium]